MAPAGRPKMGKEKKRRVNLMLEPVTYEYLREVGQGSASAGIGLVVLDHMVKKLSVISNKTLAKVRREKKS